ncbi:MAG: hypothetical protein AAGL17_07680, partial [Cyanobacteria bacterium J06576_12]
EHSVGAGVPEIDKLKAFKNIEKLLESHDLIPFESHVKVPNRNKAPNKEFSTILRTKLRDKNTVFT